MSWRTVMRVHGLTFVVALAACSSSSSPTVDAGGDAAADGGDAAIEVGGDASPPEVGGGGDAADAAADVAPVAAATPCVGAAATARRTLFLNFEGVALKAGADDAPTNTTSLVNGATSIAAFQGAAGQRDATISEVAAAVSQRLARFDLTIVTTRPAAGPYAMVVFGGAPMNVGLPANASDSLAPVDCGDARKSDLAIVFDDARATRVANAALGVIGSMVGLDLTTRVDDCMSVDRLTATSLCSFGANAPKVAASAQCGTQPQDEPAQLALAYGCKP